MFMNRFLFCVLALTTINCIAETHTWDGAHDTSNIEVTVVYFVPSDRAPLPDWRERVDYYCKRIEQFHAREFQGQSTLRTLVRSEPLVSEFDTAQLRVGDANAIYYRTLNEADRRLKFAPVGVTGKDERQAFPILLVLSEMIFFDSSRQRVGLSLKATTTGGSIFLVLLQVVRGRFTILDAASVGGW
jgi:hypothetical protein